MRKPRTETQRQNRLEQWISSTITATCVLTQALQNGVTIFGTISLLITIASLWQTTTPDELEGREKLRPCEDPVGLPTGASLLCAYRCARDMSHASSFPVLTAAFWTLCASAFGLSARAYRTTLGFHTVIAIATLTFAASAHTLMAGVLAAGVPALADSLISSCPGTFTIGEAAAVSAGMTSALMSALTVVMRATRAEAHSACNDTALDAVVSVGLAGCVLLFRCCVMPYARNGEVRRVRRRYADGALMARVCTVVLLTYAMVWRFATGCEPVAWVARFVGDHGAAWLLMGWVVLVGMSLLWVRPNKAGVERAIARKYYHVVAMAIFMTGLETDEGVLRIGGVVGLGILLAGECARVSGSERMKDWIQNVSGRLVDERDGGAIVVSHMYLLLGCSVGVWIDGGDGVLAKCGVIAVCVQDGLAAAVGKRVGVQSWGRRGRTTEGSFAGALGAVVFSVVWARLNIFVAVWAAVCTALVEAFTDQIDNWVVPMTFVAVVASLHGE